jgi:hypothetical protein
LPLGKTPEDIVGEVYVSFIKGEGSDGKHIKEARNFDPSKDLMLQLKGAIRSRSRTDLRRRMNELRKPGMKRWNQLNLGSLLRL